MEERKQETTKPAWSTPEVEELSIEELLDLAEIKVAFANTNSSGDIT